MAREKASVHSAVNESEDDLSVERPFMTDLDEPDEGPSNPIAVEPMPHAELQFSEELKQDSTLKGFVRMVEFLKKQKAKKDSENPALRIRRHQLSRYQVQIDEPYRALQKGFQLKKSG